MNLTDLQFAVLTSLAGGRNHGYGLMGEVEGLLHKKFAVATVYACFEALTTKGWIASDGDEIVSGRTRRYYRLTPAGADTLRGRAGELAAQSRLAQARLRDQAPGGGLAVTA